MDLCTVVLKVIDFKGRTTTHRSGSQHCATKRRPREDSFKVELHLYRIVNICFLQHTTRSIVDQVRSLDC
jgi:hypothetical protein